MLARKSGYLVAVMILMVCLGAVEANARPGPQSTSKAMPSDAAATNAEFGDFMRFLESHPEVARDVVNNPDILSDHGYLGQNPSLARFLDNHPQVKDDPRAFVPQFLTREAWKFRDQRGQMERWLDSAMPFLVFVIILGALLWIFQVILDNRRWNRMAKMQSDVHAKLMEKFGSSQELLAYMESEAGRRFLESAPISVEGQRITPFPYSRILWSLQAGLVLGLGGLGLLLIRGSMPADTVQGLIVCGTLALALGVGFILSAILSYTLSKRLGLLERQVARSNGAMAVRG
jgi:hypothetical protein